MARRPTRRPARSSSPRKPAEPQRSSEALPEPNRMPADDIDARVLDDDARRVVRRLQENGHEAYFVGGCVRDLMIGRTPKDYDVATSARPGQVKRLFGNGRIIGRRFRLVHIRYGNNIIETATFRREPISTGKSPEDLLITEDNEYGTAGEDARRRDFTVNGLFLEPTSHELLDYVNGMEDLESRILRTIGDPEVRMLEDPVRIMRAVKFATRLGFQIEDDTWQAMCSVAPQLERSAPPRVFEEILRLLRSGTALGAFKMLRACGALRVILPTLDNYLGPRRGGPEDSRLRAERFWRLLEALDAEVHQGYDPTAAVAIAVLFNDIVEREADPEMRSLSGAPGDRASVCAEVMDSMTEATRLNRRECSRAQRLICAQDRFTQVGHRRFSPLLFALTDDFPEALDLFGLRVEAQGMGWDLFEGWQDRFDRAQEATEEEIEAERRRSRSRSGSRRRRRKR